MINYFSKILCKNLLYECKLIPLVFCPSRFYTITFYGWEPENFCVDDEELNIITEMAVANIQYIVSKYKDTHAFTEPQFCWHPDGIVEIKIGTLENEIYEKIIEKIENG